MRPGAAAGGFAAYHVNGAGQVVTASPSKCGQFALTWLAGPVPTAWTGNRYLVVYDALAHGGGSNATRQGADALGFLLDQ